MKKAIVIGTILAMTVSARGMVQQNGQAVRICFTTDLKESGWALVSGAKARTSIIFASIGVRIEWTEDRRYCRGYSGSIRLSVMREGTPGEYPGALAYSLPYDEGHHVVVFYDRVVHAAARTTVNDLLPYVLAHEIAHILQGISRHSTSGIMKKSWDSQDYAEMTRKTLAFTPLDIHLIRSGLSEQEK